jgi:hypothetical protein
MFRRKTPSSGLSTLCQNYTLFTYIHVVNSNKLSNIQAMVFSY